MRKITIKEFGRIIETRDVNVLLSLMPIFDERSEAWVMEGTDEEYRSARDYFERLLKSGDNKTSIELDKY